MLHCVEKKETNTIKSRGEKEKDDKLYLYCYPQVKELVDEQENQKVNSKRS